MKHVSIEIIHKCPNKCMHCSSMSIKESDIHIETDKVKEVLDGLARLGEDKPDEISISGGEPFLHPGLIDIVAYGKEKGFKINIYTSGIMYNTTGEECVLENTMLQRLSQLEVDKLIFNVQSLKEATYNKIMNTKGNLKLLIESIKCSKANKIFTEIHFVPMKLNYTEIDRMISFIDELELDRISFLGLIPHGRAQQYKEELYLDKELNQKVKEKLDKIESDKVRVGMPLQLKIRPYRCHAGTDKLYIKYDGKVYGCEAFKFRDKDIFKEEIKPDSIFEKDIVDIFQHSSYLKATRSLVERKTEEIDNYEKCPIQQFLRSVEK